MRLHRPCLLPLLGLALLPAPLAALPPAAPPVAPLAAHWTLVGWNDLGMHCMDSNYELFSILPPYNVIHAHLLRPDGSPVVDPAGEGISVTYEGVADPDGSINRTSVGKTTFWSHVQAFFGVTLAPDQGLAGFDMPGAANAPKAMRWDATPGWFSAEGIPITPRDDEGRKNAYPLMKLVARGPGGALLATTSIVLPVSDEMSCKACHASGSVAAAEPPSGWANDPDVERDYRRNVLQLHDDTHLGEPAYQQALKTGGYLVGGLLATATAGTPILCARCHASNALPGTGQAGLPPLTAAVHSLHAGVIDPTNGQPLDAATNRSACYRCHPGSTTKCLRGAMGKAVGADGAMSIQCQACHGSMSRVGAADRVGWLEQPACQSCHTGTATHNNGQIRYASAFDVTGEWRQAVDATFATDADVPAPGFDLYRFSFGHGGLACEACHGSTHAEYPALHRNDNLQSQAVQGHAGVLAECAACHTADRAARRPRRPARAASDRAVVDPGASERGRGPAGRLPRLPRRRLARHGALALAGRLDGDDRLRLEALLARLPDLLLRLSQRTGQRGSEPEPPGGGDRPDARDRERRGGVADARLDRRRRRRAHAADRRAAGARHRRPRGRRRDALSGSGLERQRPLHLRGVGRLDRFEPGRGDGRRRVPGLRARRLHLRRRSRVGRHVALVARAALRPRGRTGGPAQPGRTTRSSSFCAAGEAGAWVRICWMRSIAFTWSPMFW